MYLIYQDRYQFASPYKHGDALRVPEFRSGWQAAYLRKPGPNVRDTMYTDSETILGLK